MKTLKQKIFTFICFNILKIKEGEMSPIWVQYLFYPISTYYYEKFGNKNISISRLCHCYEIHGQKYPIDMFEELKKFTYLPKGRTLKFILFCNEHNRVVITKELTKEGL